MQTKIGITPEHLDEIAHSLNIFLSDEHVLYIKTRNAHWNIEGRDFFSMHKFFEAQYQQLEKIIDDVSERIRTLGHYSIATMHGFLSLTHLTETMRGKNNSEGFIQTLLEDHQSIIMHLRHSIRQIAEQFGDTGSSNFLNDLIEKHEKIAWMLRAHLA
jgi:starvation-inducible DNA-binding protein